ncbi:Damage response protein 1 [Smittium mucronatum]|uniref:Damage response protein 1 n=1 Tax=Smittium mucronatum TaxID=133383 RepID=A0A1R0GSF8_9FUNG|nr:Damage response protein 1 [Smittium mucronatum]
MLKADEIKIATLFVAAVGISYIIIKLLINRNENLEKKAIRDLNKLLEEDKARIQNKKFTKRTLSEFTGKGPNDPVLIAVKGVVYDVNMNGGRDFYGPGGPYSIFAGRDASRLFSLFEFDDGITEAELNSPIDPLDNLTADEEESLEAYIQLFKSKYKPVGVLVESLD